MKKENKFEITGSLLDEGTTLSIVNPLFYNEVGMISDGEFETPEWCFQFNDEEVYVLGKYTFGGEKELVLKVGSKPNSNIIFRDKEGKEFKIFAREYNK